MTMLRTGGAQAVLRGLTFWPGADAVRPPPAGTEDAVEPGQQRGEPAMVENTRSGAGGYGQVREGMDVLDQNGDKIGKAGETLGGGRYFNVDAGFLGMKEYYVPFEAVTEVQDDAVYVYVTKDRLGEMGWDRRPEEQTAVDTSAGRTERAADVGRAEAETLQLREEELQARKQPVETGQVQLGKDVVEEERTTEVPVTREEVYVERRPVDRPADR